MHQRLRLGIAEAHVELDDLGSIGGHHQAGVEKAGEAGGAHGGLMMVSRIRWRVGGRHDAAVAVGAHASGVGSGVAIMNGLVILRGFERDHMAAVAEHDETDFLATQKFFDHQARTQRLNGGLGFGAAVRDDHALARGQAVGFDGDRIIELRERFDGRLADLGADEARRGNADALHEFLGVDLAAFELRVLLRGTDDR